MCLHCRQDTAGLLIFVMALPGAAALVRTSVFHVQTIWAGVMWLWLSRFCRWLLAMASQTVKPRHRRRFVERNISTYLNDHMALPPLALVLVALLQPAGDIADDVPEQSGKSPASPVLSNAGNGSDAAASAPPGGAAIRNDTLPSSNPIADVADLDNATGGGVPAPWEAPSVAASPPLLAGTVEVSFSPTTRSAYLTLNPPDRCAYMCNLTVDPLVRRQGVAKALVAAGVSTIMWP